MQLIHAQDLSRIGTPDVWLSNTQDVTQVNLTSARRIALAFPKFTDGRAYTQAFLLRRRLGFTGELMATGEVLVDQLEAMRRCGFSIAVLQDDQDLAVAHRLLGLFSKHYQGDAVQPDPAFVSQAGFASHALLLGVGA
jgi:uncharacterized protein (DUF934 family)